MTRIWSPTLFPRGIIIFQGVLTIFNFSMKFPHLGKFVNLMKDLKYEHQIKLWRKKSHYPPRWICVTHKWSPTLFHGGILIFQGVLTKFNFSTKFPHLEKL